MAGCCLVLTHQVVVEMSRRLLAVRFVATLLAAVCVPAVASAQPFVATKSAI